MNEELLSDLLSEIKELNRTHREIQQILSIMVQPQINSDLKQIFSDPKELLAYKLSDGVKSSSRR